MLRRPRALLAALALVVFLPALGGDFVYDDLTLIVKNPGIQDPDRFGAALSSDLFAVLAGPDEAWSQYWRPTYVAWLIAGYAAFGLDPAGWHLAVLAMHIAVSLLLLRLVRRLGLGEGAAFGVAALFAVHPVHTESVAWITGGSDPLCALFLLLSWLALLRSFASEAPRWLLPAGLGAYALALGSKELALVFPGLVLLSVGLVDRSPGRWRRAGLYAGLCATLGAGYWLLRWRVLGDFLPEAAWEHSALLDFPQVLLFYLRQSVFPLWLGPSYPLRPATALAPLGLLVALALTGGLLALAWRRGPAARIGLGVGVLFLLPAFQTASFYPERIVHDRYLYLPLAGLLLLLVPLLRERAGRRFGLVLAALLVPLGLQTLVYSDAWTTNRGLWERGVASDPTSGINWSKLGRYALAGGDRARARVALDSAIAIARVSDAYITRAELALADSAWASAEADLRAVLEQHPGKLGAWERLAVCFHAQGRGEDAIATLRAAREAIPGRRGTLSDNLATLLADAGRPAEALEVLREVAAHAATEPTYGAQRVALQRGLLARELGHLDEARAALEDFLRRTARRGDARSLADRETAREALAGLD